MSKSEWLSTCQQCGNPIDPRQCMCYNCGFDDGT